MSLVWCPNDLSNENSVEKDDESKSGWKTLVNDSEISTNPSVVKVFDL